jgi:Flp pilus assembly secretin CpaC
MRKYMIAFVLMVIANGGLAQQFGSGAADHKKDATTVVPHNSASDAAQPQVLLRLRVIEISPTKLRNMGYDYGRVFRSQMTAEQLDKVLDALREDGLVKILAAPEIATINNRAASVQVGGQVRVAVGKGDGKWHFENKFCGTQVNFTPTVSDNRTIQLEICVELSRADRADQCTIDGETVPVRRSMLADTTVNCKSGKTVVLGEFLTQSGSSGTDETSRTAQNSTSSPSPKKAGECTETLFIAAAEIVAATPPKTAAKVPAHR